MDIHWYFIHDLQDLYIALCLFMSLSQQIKLIFEFEFFRIDQLWGWRNYTTSCFCVVFLVYLLFLVYVLVLLKSLELHWRGFVSFKERKNLFSNSVKTDSVLFYIFLPMGFDLGQLPKEMFGCWASLWQYPL